MTLRANEYPDVWEFSDECPSPPPDYPTENKVAAFLDIFLTPQFFGRIIVWNRGFKYLANYRAYGMGKNVRYRKIDWLPEAIKLRPHIANSCEGSGHMSVFFVPECLEEFLNRITAHGHYGKPRSIIIGTGTQDDPLYFSGREDVGFLESDLFHNGECIFTFSHDAQYLYEIFRQ